MGVCCVLIYIKNMLSNTHLFFFLFNPTETSKPLKPFKVLSILLLSFLILSFNFSYLKTNGLTYLEFWKIEVKGAATISEKETAKKPGSFCCRPCCTSAKVMVKCCHIRSWKQGTSFQHCGLVWLNYSLVTDL